MRSGSIPWAPLPARRAGCSWTGRNPGPTTACRGHRLAPVHDALAGTGIRIQLIVPAADSSTRSVVLYRSPAETREWFRGHSGSPAPSRRRCRRRRRRPRRVGDRRHRRGRRRARLRTRRPRSLLWVEGDGAGPGVDRRRHRRPSHEPHRRAPVRATAVVLPDATMWAFLDEDALRRIVQRSGPLEDLLLRYRGSAAIGSAAAQAAERVAFAEVGWSWLDHRRRAVDRRRGDGAGRGRVAGRRRAAWEVDVEPGRVCRCPSAGGRPRGAEVRGRGLRARRASPRL